MKIAAVVIVYNPEDEVVANIKSYADFVDAIYVFDNTEQEVSDFAKEISHLPNIRFFHDGRNEGIAKRLNFACDLAIRENFDWLLTMDQDSCFDEASISAYFTCFRQYAGKDKAAIIGPRYGRQNECSTAECAFSVIDDTITSGALLNLSLFPRIGGFDENLFIDFVDTEYCIRAGMAGFQTIQFTNIYLKHTLGTFVKRASIKTLYLLKKDKLIHSPIRCYYSYRNMLYLEAKYKDSNPRFIAGLRPYVAGYFRRNLFYGRDVWQVIRFTLAGIRDFKHNRMGKKQE